MNNIIFVTGNSGKFAKAKDLFQKIDINVEQVNLETEELENSDVKKVSLDKAVKAYSILQAPLFVEDSGFYIEDYPGKTNFPGTLVKRSGISTNIESLLEVMKYQTNRNCYFLSCITYYDGIIVKQFTTSSFGTLSKEIKGTLTKECKSRLWQVYIPKGSTKTLAELSKEERYNIQGNNSTTLEFVKWYQEEFSCQNKLKIKKID